MNEVYAFFKKNPTFFLATDEGDQPRVRPFGAVAIYEGRLYLCTSNQKAVYRQMKANPKIELCGADSEGNWLRVAAAAVEDTTQTAKAAMLAENPALDGMYKVDDGIFAVFFLQNVTATFSSFTAEPKVVTF